MELSKNQKAKFLKVALSANKKAEAFIKKMIVLGFTTKTKQDGSFITSVDTSVEKIIRNEIKKAFPDHNITGEELGASDKTSEYRWFDPKLLENDEIFFNAARLDRSMALKTSDYIRLANSRKENIALY